MSADLLREFGNGAEDLLENPWAQTGPKPLNGGSDTETQSRNTVGDQDYQVLPVYEVHGHSKHVVLVDAEEDDDLGDFERPSTTATLGSLDSILVRRNISHNALCSIFPKSAISKPISDSTIGNNANLFAGLESLDKSSLRGSQEQKQYSTQADLSSLTITNLPNTLVSDTEFGDEWGDYADEPTDQSEVKDDVRLDQVVEDSAPALMYNPSQGGLSVHLGILGLSHPDSKTSSGAFSKEQTPPSNIPPPAILLTLIASLLYTLNSDLTRCLAETSPGLNLDMQVNTHLSVPTTAARIIAGRKPRWKRDLNLSQSMKIGPASSGKTGGMKLAGIDRSESLREDREVAEVIRLWRLCVGPFRAVITKNKQLLSGVSPTIPTISEIMSVRTAKPSEGAITAPKSCFLCGLRREERVRTVDSNVEDSFGEWWSDYWGHLTCRVFWEHHSDRLKQR